MTDRKKQILDAAIKASVEDFPTHESPAVFVLFQAGAQWADANPPASQDAGVSGDASDHAFLEYVKDKILPGETYYIAWNAWVASRKGMVSQKILEANAVGINKAIAEAVKAALKDCKCQK